MGESGSTPDLANYDVTADVSTLPDSINRLSLPDGNVSDVTGDDIWDTGDDMSEVGHLFNGR